MNIAANYEVRSEWSVIADDLVLRIKDPRGAYRARIQNIQRTEYTTPFVLSVHLYFEAPSLEEARDVADTLLSDCMSLLAFTTGGSFRRHRIRQLVDATPGSPGMRSMFLWSERIQYENPEPHLSEATTRSIDRLLQFDMPPAIRRAMRWFRLGVNATVPDDQFMNFWFALEIAAEFQKSTDKVSDKCAVCGSPLYCESCKTHTTHKPYARQAIRALLKRVDQDCNDAVVDRLDRARNGLMHGSTLEEIEEAGDDDQEPHEHVVNVLGHLVWRALVHQFPPEIIVGLGFGVPSTYLHYAMDGIAQMKMSVFTLPDGDLDLDGSLKGMKAEMVPFGPPQSALPTQITITAEQLERLAKLVHTAGDHQKFSERVYQMRKVHEGTTYSIILSSDMAQIQAALNRGEKGAWQDLFREVLTPPAGNA